MEDQIGTRVLLREKGRGRYGRAVVKKVSKEIDTYLPGSVRKAEIYVLLLLGIFAMLSDY